MRGGPMPPTPAQIDTSASFRSMTDQIEEGEDDSQSSSQASPTRENYEESDFFEGNNDSQSSIGLPTFQDMAVSEEACIPSINRLPPEVLIAIFSKLSSPTDLLNSMLVCKIWAYNSVGLLWHRPNCADSTKHRLICSALSIENPYFSYSTFVKRLNLQSLAKSVNDGSVIPFATCNRIERLTLTGCLRLTDYGLMALLKDNNNLLALDISGNKEISHRSIEALAESCQKLQGLNVSQCALISNESMVILAENCRQIKRLKLNGCQQLDNTSIIKFAHNCRNLLEIDLHQCRLITDEPVTNIIEHGRSLRELRLANCELISDSAFLNLPRHRTFDSLRILDLTSCFRLTDLAVEKIIDCAPRLRNLVLAKCRNITDMAVNTISRLGKNLHYLHLGHCNQITDDAVIKLVSSCNRIRYIDLGCCVRLTDASVKKLATLPKLRRIGLVKCHLITNDSVLALSNTSRKYPTPLGSGHPGQHFFSYHSSLERVHLSYCTNLTLDSIIRLLNSCPRLTHLSLTGVHAFLRDDLAMYCREAPPEFTAHQREVFCVFSGQGVVQLRQYLNQKSDEGRELDLTARPHRIFDADDADDMDGDDVTVNGDEGGDEDQAMIGAMGHAHISPAAVNPPVTPPGQISLANQNMEMEDHDGRDDDSVDGNGGALIIS